MALDIDRTAPVLLVKIGRYPRHHGGVGAIRSLGRLGVPIYAITEDRFTPAAWSRYVRGRFIWPTTGSESPDELLEGMLAIGRKLDHQWGRAVVMLPTDDQTAVFIAEHAPELAEYFLLPRVKDLLPRTLSSKLDLFELCRAHDIPAPRTMAPTSAEEMMKIGRAFGFPVVLKKPLPWQRLSDHGIAGTTIVRTEDEMTRVVKDWRVMPAVLIQEYLPKNRSEDWIVHAYCNTQGICLIQFTGVKVRSWPPEAGVTTFGYSAPNEQLSTITRNFFQQIGFRGIADLDWRLDRQDGCYRLLDFNPRVGAQFRLFETDTGVDVVRAMHLDLTGRSIPVGRQVEGRRFFVENLDLPARLAYRGEPPARTPPERSTKREIAWLARDDPLPAVVLATRFIIPSIVKSVRRRSKARSSHRPKEEQRK